MQIKYIICKHCLKYTNILPFSLAFQKFFPGRKQILHRNDSIVGNIKFFMQTLKSPPQRNFLPVIVHIKDLYIEWAAYFLKFPKPLRYSIGLKIDTLFVEVIEYLSVAGFLQKSDKLPYLKKSITKMDTIKVFMHIAWEMNLLELSQYAKVSEKLDSIGSMIGGWQGQVEKELQKQNSPAKAGEK